MCGLVSAWTVVASPLATLDHQSLTIHMVKHLLLMTVAAPLVLAGAPVVVLQSWMSRCLIENKVLLGGLPAGSFERRLTPCIVLVRRYFCGHRMASSLCI